MRWIRYVAVGTLGVLSAGVTFAQSAGYTPRTDAATIPSYELVSIHKNKDPNPKVDINDDPGGLTAQACTLQRLIVEAYGFSLGQDGDHLVTGAPEWAKTQYFDVRAKVDPANVEKLAALKKAETMLASAQELASRTPGYRELMLQRLLESKFHLKVHYEQRVLSLYEMTVAKGGLKMKVSQSKDPEHGSMEMSNGKFTGDNVPMSFIPLILRLVPEVERPVIDKTGVPGDYDFTLHWSAMGDTTSTENATLFTALQEQLGLKLVSGKGPIWVVVVDHAEMPSEN